MLELVKQVGTVLFDIDRTLLDTGLFLNTTPKLIANHFNLRENELSLIAENYSENLDDPRDFNYFDLLRLLSTNFDLDFEELHAFIRTENYLRSFMFEDVIETLAKLKKLGINIGIYSEGILDYQKWKIDSMGINHFFTNELIFISKNKRDPNYIKNLPKSVVVDDKSLIISLLQKSQNIHPILVDREDLESIDGIKKVLSLKELLL